MSIREEVTKSELDRLTQSGDFQEGFPRYISNDESCGGVDVMYTQDRKAGGILKDGREVWAWVSGKNVKKEQA